MTGRKNGNQFRCIAVLFYMIVSMICNTYGMPELHLSHATAMLVVDCCQFGPSWIFGLKMELMACSDYVILFVNVIGEVFSRNVHKLRAIHG